MPTNHLSHVTVARQCAVAALTGVDPGGAPAAEALARAFHALQVTDPRDRGLATEIFYGTLRRRARLDAILEAAASRGVKLRSPEAHWALRAAVYQLRCLDRVPDHAAVWTAVELIRRTASSREGAFANAVLRKIAAHPELGAPPAGLSTAAIANRYSHPTWIVAEWVAAHGPRRADHIASAYDAPAPVTVRLRHDEGLRARAVEWLASHPTITSQPGSWPESMHLSGHVDPVTAAPFLDGLWMPQDEASQLVIRVAEPKPGERILELCAGTGTKTTALAEGVGAAGEVVAIDVNADKLARNRRLCQTFGVDHAVRTLTADAASWGNGEAPFSLVVLDAPCTGLGAMRRRPEIKWRRTGRDVATLSDQQKSLVSNAARLVAPQGRLVYAVCTFMRSEGEQIIEHLLSTHSDFSLEPPAEADPDGFVRTSPEQYGRDGFFIARLRRHSDSGHDSSGTAPNPGSLGAA